MFLVLVIHFSLFTIPTFRLSVNGQFALLILNRVCLFWFTADLTARAAFAPEKVSFFKRTLTWLDLLALVPFYSVEIGHGNHQQVTFISVLALLKIFRIVSIFRFSYVLQILLNAIKASSRELFLLTCVLCFNALVFSSAVYFVERHQIETDFASVPSCMWWAIITMTTVRHFCNRWVAIT